MYLFNVGRKNTTSRWAGMRPKAPPIGILCLDYLSRVIFNLTIRIVRFALFEPQLTPIKMYYFLHRLSLMWRLSAADHSSPGAAEVEWGWRRQPITLYPNRQNVYKKKGGGKTPVSHFPSDHITPTQDPIIRPSAYKKPNTNFL